jgi:hypothetical protein
VNVQGIPFLVIGIFACVVGIVGIPLRHKLAARSRARRPLGVHVVTANGRLGLGIALIVVGVGLIVSFVLMGR